MSSLIQYALTSGLPDMGDPHVLSVDTPRVMRTRWAKAHATGQLLVVREVTFEATGPTPVHSETPRKVKEIRERYVNPHWIVDITGGLYPEATKAWREENDRP